jgi:Cu+-exporting ATPase
MREVQFNPQTIVKCDYCGNDCAEDLIVLQQKNYCCYGCATLDDVISKVKEAGSEISIKYKQYDLDEFFNQLVDYQNETIYKITISLPNIHCSSCIELLEDLPTFYSEIHSATVNFEQRKAILVIEKSLKLSFVAQLLDDIGYPPQLGISQKLETESRKLANYNLFKLAVAGFCFGNIMLFSMPHYFGLHIGEDGFFAKLFSYLSVVLSLPVVFFSGREYLVSAYKSIRAKRSHLNIPISIGIVTLFVWSLYEIFSQTGIGYLDSLAGFIFFLLIGKWFQTKIYDQVSYQRNVSEFIPLIVRQITDGDEEEWKRLDQLKKGDHIVVKNEEIIPTDGEIVSGNGLIDYSFITGESIPEAVSVGEVVFSGGCQKSGDLVISLSKTPDVSQLWDTWSTPKVQKEFNTHWTDVISKYFTVAIIVLATIAGLAWLSVGTVKALFVFSSVLIVACPCALALSAPFTYGGVLRAFSKNNFFLKEANAVSIMSRINHLIFDKTGTLTQSDAVGVTELGNFTKEFKSGVYALVKQSNHPLSRAITEYLLPYKHVISVSQFEELPGKGLQGIIDGKAYKIGSKKWILNADSEDTSAAVYVSIDNQYIGKLSIVTQYRNKLNQLFSQLGGMMKLSVLSGDNDAEKNHLQKMYAGFAALRFNLKPKDKAEIVKELKKDQSVCMMGDGLNDSSAITECDLGIAVTESLNGFYPGSDAVLLGEGFEKLPKLFALARYSKVVLKWCLIFSLTYNLGGLSFAVAGKLTPVVAAILMPLSSISVVILATLMVRIKSKKLGMI